MTFKALRLAIPVLLKRIGCDSRHDIDVNYFNYRKNLLFKKILNIFKLIIKGKEDNNKK